MIDDRPMRDGWVADGPYGSMNTAIGATVWMRNNGDWAGFTRSAEYEYSETEVEAQDAAKQARREFALEIVAATGGHPDTARAEKAEAEARDLEIRCENLRRRSVDLDSRLVEERAAAEKADAERDAALAEVEAIKRYIHTVARGFKAINGEVGLIGEVCDDIEKGLHMETGND